MKDSITIKNELRSNIKKTCPLCGNNRGWVVYESDGILPDHKIWCDKCGLIYKDEFWSDEDNNRFYDEFYLNKYFDYAKDGQNGYKIHYEIGQKRKKQVSNIKDILVRAKSPVEIGCSSGGVLDLLYKINNKTIGIDIDSGAIKWAQGKGLPARNIDLFKTKLKFDFIWTSHLLEHLTNPKAFIEQLERVSISGCTLVGLVPNSLNPKNPEGPHVPHLFNFSEKTFVQLIEKFSGFRYKKTVKDGNLYIIFVLTDKGPKKIEYSTSKEEYENHMKNLKPEMIWPLRYGYEQTISKEEASELLILYKKYKSNNKVKFIHLMIWSKLYRFFTLKKFTK